MSASKSWEARNLIHISASRVNDHPNTANVPLLKSVQALWGGGDHYCKIMAVPWAASMKRCQFSWLASPCGGCHCQAASLVEALNHSWVTPREASAYWVIVSYVTSKQKQQWAYRHSRIVIRNRKGSCKLALVPHEHDSFSALVVLIISVVVLQ